MRHRIDLQGATLRLFHAIQIEKRVSGKIPEEIVKRTIRNGYLLDPSIPPDPQLLNQIERVVGLSGEKLNAAFHKSWQVVRDSSLEILALQQAIHYLTTYGFERLGSYREEAVYIPREALEIPEIEEDLPLLFIRGMTREEILEAIVNLGSGIALSEETLNDVMGIVEANRYDPRFIERIENRELKSLLLDFYDLAPSDPEEFLRYLISKLTNESLLIKNEALIQKIKASNGKFLDHLLKEAPPDLASIFFRFKPLFLAMKSISRNKSYFNRLRKQAKRLHRPLPPDYLNSVTAQIRRGRLDLDKLQGKLARANLFRKIRLACALKFRLDPPEGIVYRVRHGRGWATRFVWPKGAEKFTQVAFDIVLASIVEEIRPGVEGRVIHIPPHVHYTLPATEKQFTGFFPTGSYISVPRDMLVGIHWTNTKQRIDLDLSAIGESSGKIGWNTLPRTEEGNVLFSGDMTDAPVPTGATEWFYFRNAPGEPWLIFVNYYNYSDTFDPEDPVEATILVAHERAEHFGENYLVNPNNVLASAKIEISKQESIVGLTASVGGENRFYFATVSLSQQATSRANGHSRYARSYLVRTLASLLDLGEVLEAAGASVVAEKPEGSYVDLSPQALDKTTILDLIRPPRATLRSSLLH